MALSATAQRMLRTLPTYYWGNELVERLLQACADEVDRKDALIDACLLGVVPGAADDTYGFLSWWEENLGLPVAPTGVSVAVRQETVRAKFIALDVVTAADALAYLEAVTGAVVTITRGTPTVLHDTYTFPVAAGSYAGGRGAAAARALSPAHRKPILVFSP